MLYRPHDTRHGIWTIERGICIIESTWTVEHGVWTIHHVLWITETVVYGLHHIADFPPKNRRWCVDHIVCSIDHRKTVHGPKNMLYGL